MISLILLFPILGCLILFLFKNRTLNNTILLVYGIIHFLCSFILFFKGSNGYEIINKFFNIDNTNRVFLLTLSIVYAAFSVYNFGYMKNDPSLTRKLRHYSYAVLLFVLSMTGAVLSTNLGLSWVFIEATTLASAYLIYFHKTKHSIEAAWKYVFICSIGIALAFVGIILLTVSSGSLNSLFYSDLYTNAQMFNVFWLKLSFVFILFGMGTKMGLAPVHFWLPDAHAQSPSPISALLSAALLNSAYLIVLNMYRIMTLSNVETYSKIMLIVMGFLSLFIAAVFIYHINNYKRMLAYSSIENMGILVIGLGLGGYGIIASYIHLIGHSLIKASYFMTSGNILKLYGTKKIKSVTGILAKDKKTGWLWMLSYLGICAFPPSILFISEFLIVKQMLKTGHIFMCFVFLFLLTIILYGMGKAVISMVFGKISPTKEENTRKLPLSMYLPQAILLSLAFLTGIFLPCLDIILSGARGF